MQTSRTKRLIFTGAAAIGILGGAAGIAGAASSQSAPGPAAAQADANDTPDASYTSSVTAPQAAEGQPEKDEAAKLQSLATVTADQAKSSALAAVPGTAKAPELDNEDGNVVWSVEVTKVDGTVTDVKVDAGNGKVLAQETDTENDGGKDNQSGDESGNESGTETPDAPGATEAPGK